MMEQSKSDSPPLDVNDPPDCSPVGSPDVADSHFPLPQPDDLPPPILSVDLRDKIIKQVEYYFSDENLVNDKFLMKYVMKNNDGYVPIGVIASFRKMKSLTKETSLVVSALRESSTLIVSLNGKKVKRRNPLPVSVLLKDPMMCTVLVENLPEDHSLENLRNVFGEAGNVENIIVRDAHALKETKNVTTAEKLVVGKLHALVEYDSVEAAEKAVALLNDEQDWRYGLRVKLLKKMGKSEQRKVYKEATGEKSSSTHPGADENADSGEHHQDSHCEEDGGEHLVEEKGGEQLQKEKKMKKEKNVDHHHHHAHKEKNEHKSRYVGHGHGHGHVQGQGQGRRQKHGSANVHGHGTSPAHVAEASKPPPGPRMPDGTRGFAMGRGRALVPSTTT